MQIRYAYVLLACVIAIMAPAMAAPKKAAPLNDPPMTAHVVRSAMPGCEPNCPQWIALDGRLTAQSPGVFRKALKLAGKKRFPVIIMSPGGDVDAALAIGKMIRQRKLDVAVGWTHYSGCTPREKACKLLKENNNVYRGLAFAYGGYCMSACPFILASGQRRLAAGGAQVGVHQISSQSLRERLTYQEEYRIVNGKKKVISRKIIGRKTIKGKVTSKMSPLLRKKLETYLHGMGVKPSLLDLVDKAPPASIYLLQAGELAATALSNDAGSAPVLVAPGQCRSQPPADHCQPALP